MTNTLPLTRGEAVRQAHGAVDRPADRAGHPRGVRRRLGHQPVRRQRLRAAGRLCPGRICGARRGRAAAPRCAAAVRDRREARSSTVPEVRIKAEQRTEFGKGAARRTRRAGKVPGVIYGHGTEPVPRRPPGSRADAGPEDGQRPAARRGRRRRRPADTAQVGPARPGASSPSSTSTSSSSAAARRSRRRPGHRARQGGRRAHRPGPRGCLGRGRGHPHPERDRRRHRRSRGRWRDPRRRPDAARGHHPRRRRRPDHPGRGCADGRGGARAERRGRGPGCRGCRGRGEPRPVAAGDADSEG